MGKYSIGLDYGTNSVRALVVDVANGDFRLMLGSPSIDTGTDDNAPDNDIDGASRPQGDGFDMGAYERTDADVNQDEKEEADYLSVSAAAGYEKGGGRLCNPQDETPDKGPHDAPQPTQDHHNEAFEGPMHSHSRLYRIANAHQGPRHPCQSGSQHKRQEVDLVNINPHQGGSLPVFYGGPDGFARVGPPKE